MDQSHPVLDPGTVDSKRLKAFLRGGTRASFQWTVWGWLGY